MVTPLTVVDVSRPSPGAGRHQKVMVETMGLPPVRLQDRLRDSPSMWPPSWTPLISGGDVGGSVYIYFLIYIKYSTPPPPPLPPATTTTAATLLSFHSIFSSSRKSLWIRQMVVLTSSQPCYAGDVRAKGVGLTMQSHILTDRNHHVPSSFYLEWYPADSLWACFML